MPLRAHSWHSSQHNFVGHEVIPGPLPVCSHQAVMCRKPHSLARARTGGPGHPHIHKGRKISHPGRQSLRRSKILGIAEATGRQVVADIQEGQLMGVDGHEAKAPFFRMLVISSPRLSQGNMPSSSAKNSGPS